MFSVNNSAKMTMLENGNLGIGTKTPGDKLEVIGNVKATKFIGDGSQLTNLNVGETGLILATTSDSKVGIGTTNPSAKLEVAGKNAIINNALIGDVGHGNEWAGLAHKDLNGETNTYGLLQSNDGKNTYINKKSGEGQIGFLIDNQFQMVVGNNGSVGIGMTNPGKTTPSAKLEVAGNLRLINFDNSGIMGVGPNNFVIQLKKSAGGAKQMTWNGGASWSSSSDKRLKTNIANEKDILPRLMKLDVKNYNWKDSPDSTNPKLIGFIAQDVKPFFPSLVGEIEDSETKEVTLTLEYANFGVLAVGAIKELKVEYDKRIAALEEIIDLKKAVSAR